jgi:hypothetical protein
MKTIISMSVACALLLAACSKNELKDTKPATATTNSHQLRSAHSTNGSAGVELVYYDSMLVKMNAMQLSDQAAASILAHNSTFNILYESDATLQGGGAFVTVTDAIQGDGYNPIWREVDIVWNSGVTPHQFYSDDQVLAAASGSNPEITLVYTNEVYRCDILQHTKTQ